MGKIEISKCLFFIDFFLIFPPNIFRLKTYFLFFDRKKFRPKNFRRKKIDHIFRFKKSHLENCVMRPGTPSSLWFFVCQIVTNHCWLSIILWSLFREEVQNEWEAELQGFCEYMQATRPDLKIMTDGRWDSSQRKGGKHCQVSIPLESGQIIMKVSLDRLKGEQSIEMEVRGTRVLLKRVEEKGWSLAEVHHDQSKSVTKLVEEFLNPEGGHPRDLYEAACEKILLTPKFPKKAPNSQNWNPDFSAKK